MQFLFGLLALAVLPLLLTDSDLWTGRRDGYDPFGVYAARAYEAWEPLDGGDETMPGNERACPKLDLRARAVLRRLDMDTHQLQTFGVLELPDDDLWAELDARIGGERRAAQLRSIGGLAYVVLDEPVDLGPGAWSDRFEIYLTAARDPRDDRLHVIFGKDANGFARSVEYERATRNAAVAQRGP